MTVYACAAKGCVFRMSSAREVATPWLCRVHADQDQRGISAGVRGPTRQRPR